MAEENKPQEKKSFSFDWLVSGVLTKLGDTFDRLTGRNWNPSSSLATSKLTEKLKFLLDSEVRDFRKKGKFVPHLVKLKIQWDKFSTDAEENLEKLEHELHAAAIDHINDKLYHTYAPINIEIKTDYFTEGVKMLSSFGKYSDKLDDEAIINVTVPHMNVSDLIQDDQIVVNLNEQEVVANEDRFIAKWTANQKDCELELNFTKNKRISIGRSKENYFHIDDTNVSSLHAALVLNEDKRLMVADTGSTNGTFINGQRIAYGTAVMFEDDAKVKIGTVEVAFDRIEIFAEEELLEETYQGRIEPEILPTQAAINIPKNDLVPETQATDASIGNLEEQLSKPDLTLNFNKEVIKPIETQTEDYSKPGVTIDGSSENLINEQSESENDASNSKETIDVNLDKTQDWES